MYWLFAFKYWTVSLDFKAAFGAGPHMTGLGSSSVDEKANQLLESHKHRLTEVSQAGNPGLD